MFVFCPRSDAAYKAIPPNRHGYGHITCFKIMGLLIISGMIKLKKMFSALVGGVNILLFYHTLASL